MQNTQDAFDKLFTDGKTAMVAFLKAVQQNDDSGLKTLAHDLFEDTAARDREAGLKKTFREKVITNFRQRFESALIIIRESAIQFQLLQIMAAHRLEDSGYKDKEPQDWPSDLSKGMSMLADTMDDIHATVNEAMDDAAKYAAFLADSAGEDVDALATRMNEARSIQIADRNTGLTMQQAFDRSIENEKILTHAYCSAARGWLDMAVINLAYLGATGGCDAPAFDQPKIASIAASLEQAERFEIITARRLDQMARLTTPPVPRNRMN